MIRKGVTGFDQGDLKDLKGKILNLKLEIEKLNNYKVLGVYDQGYSSNYIEFKVIQIKENRSFSILINAQYGYSSCVINKSVNDLESLNFIEMPNDIIRVVEKIFTVLTLKYLTSKLDSNDLRVLSKNEREQVLYWESKIKGEVIFNCYD